MTLVRAERFEVESRLAGLGLTMEEVHTIFRRAQAERSACTPLDPITLPGVVFWGRVSRFAREVYVPKGWTPKRPKLIELVVNPQETFAFTVCSGNQNTGKQGPDFDHPTSRYGKGTAMKERIAANQLVIPGMEAPSPQRDADAYAGETWCLLYYHEAVRDENEATERTRLWSELSLPENVGDRGKIDTWKERIILDPIDFDEPLALLDPDEENPPDIDVPIERLT
jgi:hypothetical protein